MSADHTRRWNGFRSAMGKRSSLVLFTAVSILSGPTVVVGGVGDLEQTNTVTSRKCVSSEKTVNPNYDAKTKKSRDEIVGALDRIRDKVEEWGVVTISAPVAVLDPTAFSVPDDIVTPAAAYSSARTDVEASAVQVTETGVSNQLGTTVVPAIIPPVPRPPAGGAATQNTTTSTTVTAPAAAGAATSPTPVPNPNEQELPLVAPTPATFAPINIGNIPAPGKSVAEALREAQDNTMRQKIYTQMSYPKGIKAYNTVVFAIVEVSCNPGWRTKEHYIAECSASLEYADLCRKKHLSLGEQRLPVVFSVLPLLDAQTVEMANSQRQVTQLAFQIAASLPMHGVNVRAKDLFQFVRRYSRDLRSRSPIPVVNSFSSGNTFGFRFSPSFQAMKDPAQRNARAGNVLLPTSFPALITVVMHDEDIDYLVHGSEESVLEPGLWTHVSTRWFLKDRPPLWQLPKRLFSPMRRDTAKMGIIAAEDVAKYYSQKDTLEKLQTSEEMFNPMYEEARRSIIALQTKGIGRDWPIPLNVAFLQQKRELDEETRARVRQTQDQNDYLQGLQQEAKITELENVAVEAKAARANTILVSISDANGKPIRQIQFDKRPFGNITGDKLLDFAGKLIEKGGNETDGASAKPPPKAEEPADSHKTPQPPPTVTADGTPKASPQKTP